jgi:hypothetical protein
VGAGSLQPKARFLQILFQAAQIGNLELDFDFIGHI